MVPDLSIPPILGLDAYFYVRFLRMMMMIFLPIWIISWAVLGPLYAAGVTTNLPDGLDKFTFGNVATTQQVRYAALIPLIYLFTGVYRPVDFNLDTILMFLISFKAGSSII